MGEPTPTTPVSMTFEEIKAFIECTGAIARGKTLDEEVTKKVVHKNLAETLGLLWDQRNRAERFTAVMRAFGLMG